MHVAYRGDLSVAEKGRGGSLLERKLVQKDVENTPEPIWNVLEVQCRNL
jgi:hypothetical protein